MTQGPASALAAIVGRPPRSVPPTVEDGVRVAAATLSHASPELITSTTFVVDIGADDLDALSDLVREVADAHNLKSSISPHVGWCTVRFSRRERSSG
jgi:hypothetical protein